VAKPRFSSLLALAKVQLLAAAHTPAAQLCTAALCSSTWTSGQKLFPRSTEESPEQPARSPVPILL